jgi:DNA-directed RNA polymerase specialized sigma24 family protein
VISARQEQEFTADRAVNNQAIAKILRRSFLTARLILGNSTQAEKTVMEAISVWNPDEEDEEQLFRITLRTAVQSRITGPSAVSDDKCTDDSSLPVELRRVTELSPPEIRHCFVLRVLVGLPSHVCAQMLHLDIHQLDQYCCDAMRTLSAFGSVEREQLKYSFKQE